MDQIRHNIYLGNMEDRFEQVYRSTTSPVTAMLTLVGHPDYYMPQHGTRHIFIEIPLADTYGNDPKLFADAVQSLEFLLKLKHIVLIHCAQGISRSPSVLATYLARKEHRKFFDVVNELQGKRTIVNPNPALVVLARKYLGEI